MSTTELRSDNGLVIMRERLSICEAAEVDGERIPVDVLSRARVLVDRLWLDYAPMPHIFGSPAHGIVQFAWPADAPRLGRAIDSIGSGRMLLEVEIEANGVSIAIIDKDKIFNVEADGIVGIQIKPEHATGDAFARFMAPFISMLASVVVEQDHEV